MTSTRIVKQILAGTRIFERTLAEADGDAVEAAIVVARDLMRGNPAERKAGYGLEDAAISACHVYGLKDDRARNVALEVEADPERDARFAETDRPALVPPNVSREPRCPQCGSTQVDETGDVNYTVRIFALFSDGTVVSDDDPSLGEEWDAESYRCQNCQHETRSAEDFYPGQ